MQKNAELEVVADRTKSIVGSVTAISFENEEFVVVTCMGMIHEVRGADRRKAFEEIYRVLKLGGVFYFTELNRTDMIPYAGPFGLAFRNWAYWERQLRTNRFKVLRSKVQRILIEFIAGKS